MEIRCFGLLQVKYQGRAVRQLARSPALRGLLGYFILHRARELDRSQVAGTFWPEVPEERARRNLSNLLWRLRQAAGGALTANLATTGHTLCWQLPEGALLDLALFDELTQELVQGNTTAELAPYEQAVALYKDVLLADCDAQWRLPARRHYHERFLQVTRFLIRNYEQLNELDRALAQARRLVDLEPYEEWGHERVARLCLALGETQKAALAYNHYVQLWRGELALPPSARMQRLGDLMQGVVTPVTRSRRPVRAMPQTAPGLRGTPAVFKEMAALYQSSSDELARLGQKANDLFAWEAAQNAYETAVHLLEQLPPEPGRLERLYELRRRCDELYDRLALRQEQAQNLNRMWRLAAAAGDKTRESDVWARRCWLAKETGQLSKALEFGHKALETAANEERQRAQALRLLGTTRELRGDYPLALTHHLEALALSAEDVEQSRPDHNNLASVYTSLARDWPALQHAQQALALTPERPPTLVRAIALGNLSNIERELGDYQAAVAHLHEAQRLAGMLGANAVIAWLAVRAAVLYRQSGEVERAEHLAMDAWQSSAEAEAPLYVIEAALEMARLAYGRADLGQAKGWLEKAREAESGELLRRYEGVFGLFAALFALEEGDLETAKEQAGHALGLILQRGDFRYLPFGHGLLALIALQAGRQVEADRLLAQARQALRARAEAIPMPDACLTFLAATPLRQALCGSEGIFDHRTLWAIRISL